MSVLYDSPEFGWIISHSKYFSQLKAQNLVDAETSDSLDNHIEKVYKLKPSYFQIVNPFIKHAKPNENENLSPTSIQVKQLYELLIMSYKESKETPNHQKTFTFDDKTFDKKVYNNNDARNAANLFYDIIGKVNFSDFLTMQCGNSNGDSWLIKEIYGNSFLFPNDSKLICDDVRNISKYFNSSNSNTVFDFVLLDPPWRNKYIRRRKRKQSEAGYELLENIDISSIPVQNLARNLVVVWCTNSSNHLNQLINEIFPKWNVEYLTTWYWIKVTQAGEPIVPFNAEGKKQPYETIVIGRSLAHNPVPKDEIDLRNTKIIMSIPSSIHSHKPPLAEIFQKYLPNDPKCLEIFARYLIPGWTSYGNEVLKLQHISLYEFEEGRSQDSGPGHGSGPST